MKKFAAILLTLTLIAGTAAAAPPELLTPYRQNTFLLFTETVLSGGRATCVGFYWKPHFRDSMGNVLRSLFASAGHCIVANHIRLGEYSYQLPLVLMYFSRYGGAPDFLVGTATDFRDPIVYFKEFEKEPSAEEKFFTVKNVPEWGKAIELQTLAYVKSERGQYVFKSEEPIQKGMSGSPVVTEKGELAGILMAMGINDPRLAYVMPMKDVLKIYELYGRGLE
ncbi:MAG: hypothetical protein HYS78_02540 [Parcubacteria group bacterium]|nr:hypothetical protein [Parcubacteria group bacterium]